MEKAFVVVSGYSEDFIKQADTGWGCGYVYIPKDHPILVKLLVDDDGYNRQIIDDFSEEITFSNWDKEREFYVIGFDTAHSWDNISNNDKAWVNAKAEEMLVIVNAYTVEDARAFAIDQVKLMNNKFSKYL